MREHNLGFFVSTISFAKTGERDGTSRNFATLPTHFQGDAQNADNLSYARTAHYKDVSYKFIKKFVPSSESEGCCGSAGIRPPRRAGPPTGCDGRVSLPRSRTTRNVHHTSYFLPLYIGRHCAIFQSGLRKESRLTIHTNRLFSIQKAAAARLAKQIEKIK